MRGFVFFTLVACCIGGFYTQANAGSSSRDSYQGCIDNLSRFADKKMEKAITGAVGETIDNEREVEIAGAAVAIISRENRRRIQNVCAQKRGGSHDTESVGLIGFAIVAFMFLAWFIKREIADVDYKMQKNQFLQQKKIAYNIPFFHILVFISIVSWAVLAYLVFSK